ncbi:hypothetical protein [Paraburkholderia sp. JHI869]|uniref:hypothetical protein n=1 Tax=Paraburkholderia sp. JHI869 TaxID=3112959 RepID=UPI00317EF3D4
MKKLIFSLLAGMPSLSVNAEDFVCPDMPTSVTSVSHDVRNEIEAAAGAIGKVKAGEVNVKTDVITRNLFEKFPNVDKTLSIQIMSATYCSMLKKSNLTDRDRLSRWEKFQNGILHIGSADQTTPKNTKLSFADRLLLDENPTKLTVSKIVLEQWVGDSEPYVTLQIQNISKRTAIGVKPWLSAETQLTFEPTRTASLFRTGVSIDGGDMTQYPVAPVSAFVGRLRPCNDCSLVGVGLTPLPPDDIMAAACQASDDNERCAEGLLAIPFGINLRYRSIFDQSQTQFFAAFAYFKIL